MAGMAADIRSADQLIRFIEDGGRPKYVMFWGHQPPAAGGVGRGCLSQWWPAPFTVGGVAYSSAEHFMMSAKALLFGDTETAERVRTAPHPGAAKALAFRACPAGPPGSGGPLPGMTTSAPRTLAAAQYVAAGQVGLAHECIDACRDIPRTAARPSGPSGGTEPGRRLTRTAA